MSDFDQLTHQAKTVSELIHLIQAGRIPNALLFYGNTGTGKKKAALLCAKGCNCRGEEPLPCNHCKACRKIDAGSHPDILSIRPQPDKKIISISQIRDLSLVLSSRPNEARMRVVMIPESDRMNVQAQNALLKILEEPPDRTFFILMAARLSLLLPTIISRCRSLRFSPLTDKKIEDCLIEQFNAAPELARIVSGTAGADLEKARVFLNLSENEGKKVDWIKRRKWLLDTVSSVLKGRAGTAGALGFSEKLARDPDLIDDSLAVLRSFFRDLMIFKIHPQKIVNLDFFDTFSDINEMVKEKTISNWLHDIFQTEKRLASNSAARLVFDRLFLKIICERGNIRL